MPSRYNPSPSQRVAKETELPVSRLPVQIANRMRLLEPSGIRRFFDLASKMKDPINLSIGQADYEPPAVVIDAAIAAMKSGFNRYSVTQGIDPLREKLRAKLSERLPISFDDDLIITSGVSGGLMLSYLCALNPGDGIMLPDPYFVMYRHLAHVAAAEPVFYSIYPDFAVTRERLEAAYKPHVRALLVNSPSNPTGYVMTAEEVKTVADFARERDLLLITDEIYDTFVYDRPHLSPRQHYDRTLVLGGFSKSLGIPGWRMGYALGPAELLEQMRILQQFSFVCAPTPAQHGVMAGLDFDFSEHRAAYQRKRDFIYDALKDNFRCVKPEGAFYIFPQLPEGRTDSEFVEKCIERNLLVVPGSACCSRKDYIRISFAATDDALKRGADVLNAVARGL